MAYSNSPFTESIKHILLSDLEHKFHLCVFSRGKSIKQVLLHAVFVVTTVSLLPVQSVLPWKDMNCDKRLLPCLRPTLQTSSITKRRPMEKNEWESKKWEAKKVVEHPGEVGKKKKIACLQLYFCQTLQRITECPLSGISWHISLSWYTIIHIVIYDLFHIAQP